MSENLQILPFYLDVGYQYHRLYRAFGNKAPVLAPNGYLPPFQVMLPTGYSVKAYTVSIVTLSTGAEQGIKTPMVASGLEVRTYAEKDFEILYYPSSGEIDIPDGLYYLKVAFTGGWTLYSEVFAVADFQNLVSLTWWDDESIEFDGQYFDFSTGFKFVAFFQSEFGKPQYQYEDAVKRRDGIDFPEKIISWKVYRCEIICSEFFLDGLRVARLHSFIEVNAKGKTRKVYDLTFTLNWDEPGFYAVVTLDFQMETIAKMTGKGKVLNE